MNIARGCVANIIQHSKTYIDGDNTKKTKTVRIPFIHAGWPQDKC